MGGTCGTVGLGVAAAGEGTVEEVEGIINDVIYGGSTGGVYAGGTLRMKFMLVLDAGSVCDNAAGGALCWLDCWVRILTLLSRMGTVVRLGKEAGINAWIDAFEVLDAHEAEGNNGM